jgi:uncharacterized protein with FMN-binding domain
MKRKGKIALFAFILVAIAIAIFSFFLFYGKEETLNLVITDIDFSKIPDGIYSGSYNKGRFGYRVEVDVRDGRILNINVINKPKVSLVDIPEKIINRVIEKQSLNIDTITGATVTSKAILKAIENALK